MAKDPQTIQDCVESIIDSAPAGFAMAFHINFTTPKLLLQTYSRDWVKHYSENGLVMSDPTVLWGFENDGTKRWADLADLDSANVLVKAKDYGMNFGLTCALTLDETRTIASFARSDREYDDAEIADLQEKIAFLHTMTARHDAITPETKKALDALSVHVQAA